MRAYGVKKIVFSSSATVYGVQESPKCEGVDADGCRDYKPLRQDEIHD